MRDLPVSTEKRLTAAYCCFISRSLRSAGGDSRSRSAFIAANASRNFLR